MGRLPCSVHPGPLPVGGRTLTLACTIDADALTAAVKMVARVAPARPHQPVLAGVRLEVAGDRLMMAATNLDTSMTTSLAVTGDGDGVAVVDARRLASAAAMLSGQAVLGCDDGTVTLRAGRSSYAMGTYPVAEFPHLPAVGEGVTVDGPTLLTALSGVVAAASADLSRPILCSVRVAIEDGRVTLAATDSYRLHTATLDLGGWAPPSELLLPALSVAELVRLDHDGPVDLAMAADHHVSFSAGLTTLTTTLVAGSFPDHHALIDNNRPESVVTVDSDDLTAALRRASWAASKAGLRLTFSAGRLLIEGQADDGSTSTDETDVDGDASVVIGMRPSYLADAIAAVSSPRVSIGLLDQLRPVTIRPEPCDGSRLALVMPIRLTT